MVLHLADYEKVYIKSNQNFETVFCFYAFIICRRSEKEVLDSCEVNGMNIVNSMGYGNQKGIIKNYRGSEYAVNLLPKVKVETVVTDEVAPTLIDKIVKEINTGHFGDGKIFVYDVEDAVRIRTGEHGTDAL